MTLDGGNYELSCYYSQRPNDLLAPSGMDLILFDESGAAVTPDAFVNPVPNGIEWVQFTRSYSALAAGTYTVTFEITTGGTLGQANLDDFSLVSGGGIEKIVFTDVSYDPVSGQTTLTWDSVEDAFYFVEFSEDLENWEEEDDAVLSGGTSTVHTTTDSRLPGLGRIYFRVTDTRDL